MNSRALVFGLLTLPLLAAGPDPDPSKLPTKPQRPPVEVEGQVLLIGFREAPSPIAGVTRSRQKALARANEVVTMARAKGSRFDDLVLKYSDDPRKGESLGELGSLAKGEFPVKAVEDALFGMEEGQVSDPIETPAGYAIATRLPYITFAAQIVVQYRGCKGAPPSITRTKEEASARAEEIHRRLAEGKEDFSKVAKEYSDDATRGLGGHLGKIMRGRMPHDFDAEAFKLRPGEVSPVIDLADEAGQPLGFYLIQGREYWDVSHILITFQGSKDATLGTASKHTKEEARKIAQQALDRLKTEDFDKVAREMTEDPTTREEGGRLGYYDPQAGANWTKPFLDAMLALKPRETSGIVETEYGFHIIRRWR